MTNALMQAMWIGLVLTFASSIAPGASPRKQIAITIDDVDVNADDTPTLTLDQRNAAILEALSRARVRAAVFVTGMRVDNDAGRRHVAEWSKQGHLIANHTYSHLNYSLTDFDRFSKDVLRGESIIREYPGFEKLLRFPYLKEGATAQQRDDMRQFMMTHGYRNGFVTVDASDWAIDARLRRRLRADPKADVSRYRDFYLEHIAERVDYYDGLAHQVIGRPVNHTLLIHHNLLQALFLDDLLAMLKAKGWTVIEAAEAYKDPIFAKAPNIAPAGESLVWALAKESGRFEGKLRYPAEDSRYEDPRMDALGL